MSFSHRRCIFPRGVEWHNSLEHTSIYLPLSASVCLCATFPLSASLPLCFSITLPLFASVLLCLCQPHYYLVSSASFLHILPVCLPATLSLYYSVTLPLSASLLLCLCLPLFAVNVHLPYITDYTHLPCCLYCCTCSMKCNIEQNNWKKGLLHAPSRKRGEFNPLNSKHFFTGLFVLICEPKH